MAYADISVRNAANKALANKGWREVKNEANADALLSYDVLVHRPPSNGQIRYTRSHSAGRIIILTGDGGFLFIIRHN